MTNTKRKLLLTLTLIVSISLSLKYTATIKPLSLQNPFNTSLSHTCTAVMALLSLYLQSHQRLFLLSLSLSLSSSVSFGLDFDMIIRRRRAQSEDEYDGLVGEGEGHEPILLPGPTKLSSSPAMQPRFVILVLLFRLNISVSFSLFLDSRLYILINPSLKLVRDIYINKTKTISHTLIGSDWSNIAEKKRGKVENPVSMLLLLLEIINTLLFKF